MTDEQTVEERIASWGPGPLRMPDGIDAETWIAASQELEPDEVLESADLEEESA